MKYGAKCLSEIKALMRQLLCNQTSSLGLLLPMQDPNSYFMIPEFEKLGFFFSGILPRERAGDVIILQYLGNVALDYGKIQLLTGAARDILNYIRERDPNQQ
jgi:serine/threonine-protein kinase RsbW